MATVDMTQRKLNFPPRFLPYLEKHRIFELLHECVEMLVQVRPKDHIQFLKNALHCAARKKDKQRIVFLAPQNFDREKFAELLSDCLGIPTIDRQYVEFLTREQLRKDEVNIVELEESVEDESCICPGEYEPMYPIYYPAPEEPIFAVEEEDNEDYDEEVEEQVIVATEPEPEPSICVCPCVKKKSNPSLPDEKGGDAYETTTIAIETITTTESSYSSKSYQQTFEGEMFELPCPPAVSKSHRDQSHVQGQEIEALPSESILEINYALLGTCEVASKGWILSDFPMSGGEAEKLCELGVLPTHAIHIIFDEKAEMENREYKWIVINWKKAYRFVPVMEIKVGERSMPELAADMCKLLSTMPHRHAPMLPRIVLIGSRGSGVTTQAQKLAKKYGMVHVEFEDVIARALQQDDDIVKLYKQQLHTRVEPEVEAVILERALLTTACRNRGWVLTGYPKNIDQMRMLDIVATPPNRTIFLEVPAKECFVRLYYRKFDPCLGDEYKIPKIEPFGIDSYATPGIEPEVAARLLTHPKNNKKQIIHDIETYFNEKTEMMNYCGKTAAYIDGNKTVDVVFEFIEKVIIDPAPAQPPRDPLVINYGIDESYGRLKKFRMASGMYLNNLVLNPPETPVRM